VRISLLPETGSAIVNRMKLSVRKKPMISALCVDDEQILLDLYKIFLEQSGEIQVDTADSVKTAVGKLKKIRYDVIVSDYSMPEYDGIAFLKCILPTYGDIPFILFTGKGREDTVIEALNNGARFYVQKGEDPKEQFADLIQKIKLAVGLKEVEDALRTSELRYRKLFETANDGIILLDADTGEIINANPFLVNLIGSSLEEIRGKHLWDIGVFKDVDRVKKAFLELPVKKNIRYEDLPLMTKDDREIVVEFVGTVYTVDHADVIQCNIRDITGRKRMEEAMRIQHNLALALTTCQTMKEALELTLDAALQAEGLDSGGIYMADPVTGALDIAVHRGLSPEFVEHTSHFDADALQVERAKTGTPFYGRYADIRPTGKDELRDREGITALASIPVLHGGNLVAIMNMASHIHDDIPVLTHHLLETLATQISGALVYIHSEEALKESEAKYRLIADNTADSIWIFDMDMHLQYISPSVEKMKGYTVEEVLSQSLEEMMTPESLESLIKRFHQEMVLEASGTADPDRTVSFETEEYCRSGATILVENSVTLLRDAQGRPVRMLGISRDITGRKQTEEALRVIQEKYTKAFISAPDAITISELDSGRFVEVNEAATAIFGYSREELIGKTAVDLGIWLKKEDRDAFIDQIRAKGRVEQFEIMERRKSGEPFNASVTADTITIGNIRYLIAIVRDISDLKRAEEQLKHFNEDLEKGIADRTEKLNDLLEEKVLLLREVHHRVKNNLQIILSLIRLQSRTIKDPQFLDTMGEFQNRIMAMAHVHERMYRAEDISRIDLAEIVTFLGKSLFKTYKADPQHIRLNIEMNDIQIPITSAIPISLIMNELISNSLKHAFPKGTTGEITIAGRREADTIVLLIRDTGIGIPEELDWKRNEQSLGLRLVVSLVEQLDGTIELDRTTGTAFNIVVKEKE
jgi:PAS domain S-box-containing protein